ncbi:aminotransferase class IV [Amycolatopsis lurida]
MTSTAIPALAPDPLLGPGSPVSCCWVDGRWTTVPQAGLTVATQALHYGTGVFEGIRAYWNAQRDVSYLFRLSDHVDRFLRGCRLLRIDPKVSAAELRDVIVALVERSGFRGDLYLRPLALKSRLAPGTPFGVGLSGVEDLVAVYAVPMPSRATLRTVSCSISSWRRVPSAAVPPQAKLTGSYVNVALAVDEARAAGFDEAIMLNTGGTVAEASTSNVFALHGNTLTTPSRDSDILPGITRDCVLELTRAYSAAEVREAPLPVPDLLMADEVFLSGTGGELVAVTGIGGRAIGTGAPGPVTAELFTRYRAAVLGTDDAHAHWNTAVPAPADRAHTDQKDS